MFTSMKNFQFQLLAAATVCLIATVAVAQSDTPSQTGTAGSDLQLSGPANPAPAAKIDIPSVDDATTKFAPKSQDVDAFIAGDPPAIRDPERQSEVPDVPDTSLDPIAQTGAESTAMKPVAPTNLEERIARLEKVIEAQSALLGEMAQAQADMLKSNELVKLREEIALLRQTFQTVARPDLNSDAASLSPSLETRGTLVVENLTGVGYNMNINGIDFAIMPGRREFNVPVGMVITEITGYEPAKTWSAENFRQVGDDSQLAIQIK